MKARAGVWSTVFAAFAVFAVAIPIAAPRRSEPASTAPPIAEVEQGPLVAPGAPADLALIYTGGVVGYVEPCG